MTPSPSGLQSTSDHDPAGTRTNPRLYPDSIQHDLDALDLPQRTKDEILTCAYQYTRCIIPHHTNSRRYLAFMRTVIIGTVAEFRGDLVDITTGDGDVLGYSLGGIMEELFGGTGFEEDMSREFRTFLLFTADKTCPRRHGELYRRYRIALAHSPAQWFRLRDADALVRFSIAAALACNDRAIGAWAGRFGVLAEVAVTLYDAVAFHKHMAEGEVCTTFAYVPARSRTQAFGRARDVLWALDAAGADEEDDVRVVLNLVRALGGPIHMMMHRYRFVEEDLTIGRPGDDAVRDLAKRTAKLWFRDDGDGGEGLVAGWQRYEFVMSRHKQFLFSGLEQILAQSGSAACFQCRQMVLANERGVGLCKGCERVWREYMEELPARVVTAFHGRKVGNLARSDGHF